MYKAITRSVTVTVEPSYLEMDSHPENNVYVWAYKVRIENGGSEPLQLLARHWKITDALGRVQEVRGEGVVGEKPVIVPGGSYEYTSGAPLTTPSGIMAGSYAMRRNDGSLFDVEIPAFSLDVDGSARQVN